MRATKSGQFNAGGAALWALDWMRTIPAALALLALSFIQPGRVQAASPSSGSISPGQPTLNWASSIFGAGTGENTCQEGVTCDSFRIVLAPGDYTGKQLQVTISWLVAAYDYDLFVHKGTATGPVLGTDAGAPPATMARSILSISPGVLTQSQVFVVHEQAATVPAGSTLNGEATLVSSPVAPLPIHVAGNIPFSGTVPLIARGTVRDGEPSLRVDVRGNCYAGGIRGVPAGVDLWRIDLNPASPTFDPEMRHATYLGQPDVFQQTGAKDSTAGGADGGGDIDLAMNFPTSPDSTPVLTLVSLAAANISSSVSSDRGNSFQHMAAVAQIASDDRQWVEADGPNDVYLFYRGVVPLSPLFVQKSTDHGITWGAAHPVLDTNSPASTTPGYIDVDHHDGTVYVAHLSSSALFVSRSRDGGQTWALSLVNNSTAHGHLFDVVKVGDDGTVYCAWSSEQHIYLSYSQDHAQSWSGAIQVDDGVSTRTNIFPWLEAGSAGRVDLVWYGSESDNVNSAQWKVYFSQTLDALSPTPTFRQQVISDHVIHGSNVSEGGLTGASNRNILDYFQIAYDPQGAAVVAFTDDHNDFDGATYVVRQLSGQGLLASAGGGSGAVAPVLASGPDGYTPGLPQVTDPVHDATAGPVQPILTDNPFDITSITYFCDDNGPNAPYLGARMALSGLTTLPPNGSWRMSFTANAPYGQNYLPYGVSDLGDQFYIQAADTAGQLTFNYGIGFRDSMPNPPAPAGSPFVMAYSWRGAADSARIDTAGKTITVMVALSKINSLLNQAGHVPIGVGSWLCGLRGTAATVGANGARDNTRGGTQEYQFRCSITTGVESGGPNLSLSLGAEPNPMRGVGTLRYALPRAGDVAIHIFDVQGRKIRTLAGGKSAAGLHSVAWDGRDSNRSPVPSGIYFARLFTAGHEVTTRIAVLR